MEYSNTGILQPMLLQYWDLLNSYSIHIITVYIIQQGYMLNTFFHTNVHYFTQILNIYLLTLYMHNFSHVFKNVDLLLHVYLYFYTYNIYYAKSILTHTLNSRNYWHTFYNVYAALLLYNYFLYFKMLS